MDIYFAKLGIFANEFMQIFQTYEFFKPTNFANLQVDFVEGSVEEFIPEELTAHLIAISGKYTKRIYPPRPHPIKALKRYAELPYPIPVGPSIFFCSFFLVLTSWWMRHVLTFALRHTAATLDLYR